MKHLSVLRACRSAGRDEMSETSARAGSALRRLVSGVAVSVLVAGVVGGVSVVVAGSAGAVPGPVVQRDAVAGVTSDVLPTAQMNGVAWAQTVVGNVVYVGGSFSAARPAGAAAGTSLSARSNLMAYTLSTGVMTGWAPSANGQVRVMALSPNGQRLYVGGDFTTINGVATGHLAAFDTATGALVTSFAARTDATVRALAATDATVYAGGGFSTADGVARSRLAAFAAGSGAVLGWNPGADVTVFALTMNPSLSLVIVGGAFDQLAGTAATGLGALDPTSGARVYWAATDSISAYGQDNNGPGTGAAIYSLSHDATSVYGTAYNYYGYGDLEGTFKADGNTGVVSWVEDCHGDTYAAFASGAAVYTVSHAHYCGNIGGYPQSNPWSVNMRHALAFTPQATGTINHDPMGYYDWYGTPSPSLVNWFPDFYTGSYTGQGQAAWTITGNSQYVVAGGEFPSVNQTAQQGLARFAVPSLAPKKQGPRLNSSNWTVSARAMSSTSNRVSFTANYDRDDENLTYQVIRSGKIVYTTTATSQFWNLPTIAFTDTGLSGGSSYSYYVKVTDGDGNAQYTATNTVTMPTNLTLSQYATDVYNDGAGNYWRLDEASGTTSPDDAGTDTLTVSGGVTHGSSGAINGDSNTADTFDGSNGLAATQTAKLGPDLFSEEGWFKTTTTAGGKIVGFGNANTGTSSNYDRHTYMNPNGTVTFGVYNNGSYVITTPKALNDGQWHYFVGTLSSTGMAFYMDGRRVGTNAGTTVGQSYSGYWRIGGDSPWSGNAYFNGSIDEVAIYPTALSLAQVQQHYTDSGRTTGIPAAPTDTYGKAVYQDAPDNYYRMNETSGPNGIDASPNGNDPGVYSGGETFGTSSPVAGAGGTAVTFNGSDGTLASPGPISDPTVYSEELWFKTTTTAGGKLIGFGSKQTGNSDHYDRHVYMLNSGQLVFGTWTGQTNLATSNNAYNDGSWHYLVATQGADGMKLYVDNTLAATNGQTSQEAYSGYWRIGGDTSWAASNYFAGTIDEAAVYSSELTPAQIAAHYNAASAVNHPPTAAFSSSTLNLTASVDGTASADSDGTISSYAWNFGDGTSGTGATTSHTYAASGTYSVALTVTDNGGAANTKTQSVTVTAAPANQPPTAAFTSTVNHLAVAFDSSGSVDPDGSISSYAWDFGDGATSTSANPSHTYAAAGPHSVTLTVTDNQGASTAVTHQVTAIAPNQLPTAMFSASVSGLVATFSSAGSSDPDGTISSYAWDFGDGSTSSSQNPNHTYAAGGSYAVVLTVTDNDGGTNSVSHTITPVAPNQAPTAAFTSSQQKLVASFDSSGSSDPDGTISSYSWDFGDGATSTSAKPSHTYSAAGTYQVSLTVTDNQGSASTVTHPVTVSQNVSPTAVFTSSVSGLVATFSSAGSSDSDGTISSYAWDFGDGATSTSANPSHTYAAAGTYPVLLTVTDNDGGTGSVTHNVTTVAGPVTAVADAFERTVSGGWGSAGTGGAWTRTAGAASAYSVDGHVGTMTISALGGTVAQYLNAVSERDISGTVDFGFSAVPTGGGAYAYVAVRHTSQGEYRIRIRVLATSVVVQVTKVVSGTETTVASVTAAGVTYNAGDVLRMKFAVNGTGTTTLQGKVWKVGAAEPAAWNVTTSDTTAGLQTAGTFGLIGYLSGTAGTTAPLTVRVDNLNVTEN